MVFFLNPNNAGQLERMKEELVNDTRSFFSPETLATAFPHLFRLLWQASLPCGPSPASPSHMLQRCAWAGRPINCSAIFRQVPTDSGICCAFNTASALRPSDHTVLVEEMAGGEEAGSEVRNAMVGSENGLTVMVDQHSDEASFGTVATDYTGFNLFIGEPGEFPVLGQRSIKLRPGMEHFLQLDATSLAAAPNLRDLAPADRGCAFGDERELEFYAEYSHTSCMFECKMKAAALAVGCVPWHLPRAANSTTCDPWGAATFAKALEAVEQSRECSHCLPDCQQTVYSVAHSQAPFR
jgi:hypothetical protein